MAVPYSRPYVHPLSKPSSAPVATGGRQQPASARGPKAPKPQAAPRTVRVKAHTRTVAPRAPKAPANPDQALIDAAVRSRFAPQEQALNQQLQQNTRYTSGLPAWYSNALDEIRGLQSAGQTQTQQTLGQLGQYNSQAVLANPNDQQAANARNNLNAEFAAQQGQVGQANSGALDRLMAAFVIQQGNTQNQANRDRSLLLGQQGQLKGQEGDFRTTYGAQLQGARQTAALNQEKANLAAQALGLKVDTLNQVQIPLAKSLAQSRTAGSRVARTNARTNRARATEQAQNDAAGRALARQRLSLDQWKATHPNSGRGAGANSTYSKSKIQGFRQNWDYAQATAHQLKGKGTYTDKQGKRQNISVDVAYSALLNATKDPDIARAAALTAFGKPIPAGLRHRLAIKGVHAADPPVGRTPGGGPYGTGRIP